MKNDLIKQEFIIKSLKPYFEDINNCGYDSNIGECAYETCDGKKCVVGQYLNTKEFNEDNARFHYIALKYTDFNDILMDDAKYKLTIGEWNLIQYIHDDLAFVRPSETILCELDRLEIVSNVDLTELKQMLPNYEPIIF